MDDTTRMGSVQGRSLRKLFWWGLGTILLIAAVAFGVWWWKFRDTLHYVTARATRGDIRRSINMTGALNPVVTAQVGSYVSGNIKSWSCDYNTEVKIGQQCALIDPLPFQVVVDEDAADVRTSKAQLMKDKAAAANARLVYERDKKLTEQGIVSQETLDADKATLDQDIATIDLDVATIASKEAALHAAQVNLDYTKIVSPVNGTVITRYIDVGYTVVSSLQSSTLFLIGKDMTKMQVDTNVSEADVGEVHAGQKASFTVQAFPNRTFEASVRQVRKGPITVQNVVTYDVVLDVDNKDLALLPGMTSDTHIITAERKNVLRVPLPATRFVPEGLARPGRGGIGGEGAGSPGGRAGVDEGQESGSASAGGSSASVSGTGAGATSSPGAAASASSQGDNNQQRHRRWDHQRSAQQVAGTGEAASANGAATTQNAGVQSLRDQGARSNGGPPGARRARGPRAMARIWVLRDGKLTPVTVRTGLDDGTLIEVWSDELKEGDEVVVNAVRPNAPRTTPGDRTQGGGGQGQPNPGRGGGAGFRL